MALTDEQLLILKDELDNDPKMLGYAGKSDPECAALLNEIGLSGETIGNTALSARAVRDEIIADEFAAISQGKRDLIILILGNGDLQLDITNEKLVAQFMSTFTVAAAPDTRAALTALETRPCSRAEALFDANVSVTYLDVGRARTGDY